MYTFLMTPFLLFPETPLGGQLTDWIDALEGEAALQPGQHDLLGDVGCVREEDRIQVDHPQEDEVLGIRLEIVEHLWMRQRGHGRRCVPAKDSKRPSAHHAVSQLLELSGATAHPHVVLEEQHRPGPHQAILYHDGTVGVRPLIAHEGGELRQVVGDHRAPTVVAVDAQVPQLLLGHAQVVDEQVLAGQLGGNVLSQQDGRCRLALQHICDDGEVALGVVVGRGNSLALPPLLA